MRNKVIIILATILIFGMCFTLGYVINNKTSNKASNDKVNVYSSDENNGSKNNNLSGKTNKNDDSKYSTILPNSRLGNEIIKNFNITNIYSLEFYKLLDSENLSDKVKRSLAFIDITQGNDYIYMLEYSDDSTSSYISRDNMHEAISSIFYLNENIEDGDIIYNFKYDQENKKYVIPAIGVDNGNQKIVIEVPEVIYEYSDRYEVIMDRLYIKEEMLDTNSDDTLAKMKISSYYDLDMKNLAVEIEESGMYGTLSEQRNTLKSYIDNGSINKDRLEKTKYTLIKVGSNYKISKYEKI